MREFQEKKRFRRILYSKVTAVILIILIIFLARATWSVYQKEMESAANVARAKKELETLEARHKVLSSSLSRLDTPEGQEEDIRSKYSVSKPGESVIVIVDSTSTPAATALPKESWWDRFKQLFK